MGSESHAPTALPTRNDLGIHCTGDWVELRAASGEHGEEKIPNSQLGYNPGLSNLWRQIF